jgi:hypothetical protein
VNVNIMLCHKSEMLISTARRDRNVVQRDSQRSSTANGKHVTAKGEIVRACSPEEEERKQ